MLIVAVDRLVPDILCTPVHRRHMSLCLAGLMFSALSPSSAGAQQHPQRDVPSAAGALAKDIGRQLTDRSKGPKIRLAVQDLDFEGAGPTLLSAMLAEEMTTTFTTGFGEAIAVIERRLLASAIEELRRGNTDKTFDDRSAQKIGRLVGAQYILTGTIIKTTDFALNARVIDVERGEIVAAARVALEASAVQQRLLSRMRLDVASEQSVSADGLLAEDFSSVAIGHLPKGWQGTDNVRVEQCGPRKCLAMEKKDSKGNILLADIRAEGDFELSVQFHLDHFGYLAIELGPLRVWLRHEKPWGVVTEAGFLDQKKYVDKSLLQGQQILRVRRKSLGGVPVFSLDVGGQEIFASRRSDLANTVLTTLRVSMSQSKPGNVRVYTMSLRR